MAEILGHRRVCTRPCSRQELGKGFTSNGKEDSVTVFDLKTLEGRSPR